MADAAQYAIEIAAAIGGSDKTTEELDKLTKKLTGGGQQAKHFELALVKVSASLAAAQGESATAAQALALGATKYKALEKAATASAKAAERAARKNKGVVPPKLAAQALEAMKAVDSYTDELVTLEDVAGDAAAKVSGLEDTMKGLQRASSRVATKLGDASTKVSTLRGSISGLGGPLGRLGGLALVPVQAFTDMNARFGRTKTLAIIASVGVVALTAAVAALAVAAVAATAGVAAMAIKLADSARSAKLATSALVAMHPELALLGGTFEEVTDATGLESAELQKLALSLTSAGVSARDLPGALKAAALAEAALGSGGASSFIQDLKAGKISVDEFAANAQEKFGGIVTKQMLGLSAQGARLKRNLGGLFGGLKIESLLKSLTKLVALFDENTVAGETIKFLFESIFQPIIDGAAKATVAIEAFALGFLIGVVEMYISIKPYIKKIQKFLGFDDTKLSDVLGLAKKAGKALAIGLGVLVGVFVALVAAQLAVYYGFYKLGQGIVWVVSGLWKVIKVIGGALKDAFLATIGFVADVATAFWDLIGDAVDAFKGVGDAVFDFLLNLDWGAIGSDIIHGIADGISAAVDFVVSAATSVGSTITGFFDSFDLAEVGMDILRGLAAGLTKGGSIVLNAMKNIIGGAIKAAKSMLGIASKSKVFASIGGFTSEGFASGVDKGIPAAQSALESLVSPPEVNPIELAGADIAAGMSADVGGPKGAASGGAGAVSLDGVTFNFYGVEGAADAEQRFGEALLRVLEGDAAGSTGELAPA